MRPSRRRYENVSVRAARAKNIDPYEFKGGVAYRSKAGTLRTRQVLAEDTWHHLLVEADRKQKQMRIHLNGKQVQQGPGLGRKGVLANAGDFYIGRDHDGSYVSMDIQFLRVAHATLEQSETNIKELYAWQMKGPARHDRLGRFVPYGQRDAGAIQSRGAP